MLFINAFNKLVNDALNKPVFQGWDGGIVGQSFDNVKYAKIRFNLIDVLISSGNGRVSDKIKCPTCGLIHGLGPGFDMRLCKCDTVIRHFNDSVEITVERFRRKRLRPSIASPLSPSNENYYNYYFNGKRVTKDEYDIEYALHLLTHS